MYCKAETYNVYQMENKKPQNYKYVCNHHDYVLIHVDTCAHIPHDSGCIQRYENLT